MRVELTQEHQLYGRFELAAEVTELPNGDLFIGDLSVGFPEDACTRAQQDAFVRAEVIALKMRLGQEWFRLKGFGPAEMKLIRVRQRGGGGLMKKIPCLFVRTFGPRHTFTITPEVTPGCEWVIAGEGVASQKWDGSACLLQGGKLYARFDAKKGKQPPVGALPCEPAPDPTTGHWPHWIPVGYEPQFQWHREALTSAAGYPDGTYELVGPKVNGNNDRQDTHRLIRHGANVIDVPRRDFESLRDLLNMFALEGLVFAHPDGRMAKIRRDDFGFAWPVEA